MSRQRSRLAARRPRRIPQHDLYPGPHGWGYSWEGLTQTRLALPYAGAPRCGYEEARTPGFRVWEQIQERFIGTNYQKPFAEDGKVGAEMSNIKSQMHSADDSAKSVPDSDLADGELRKMLASPPYEKSRGL